MWQSMCSYAVVDGTEEEPEVQMVEKEQECDSSFRQGRDWEVSDPEALMEQILLMPGWGGACREEKCLPDGRD